MILLHVDFPLFPLGGILFFCWDTLILMVVAVVDGDGDCLELVAVRHGSGDEGGVLVHPCTDRRDKFLKL